MNLTKLGSHWTLCVLLALIVSQGTGCGLFAQVQYWMYGYKVDPKFNGLEEKKIAIVCVSADSVAPNDEAFTLANTIGTILGANVKGCEVIPQSRIADWMDKNDWDQVDYGDVGRGVEADMVIGIDLESFSIKEGQTLLKGRSDVRVRVLDMAKNGDVVYGPIDKQKTFPENAARHITESEANFRKLFIYQLAQAISHDFYPYDRIEDFAVDTAINSN